MKTSQDLRQELHSMDRCGYPAYKSLRGAWRFPRWVLVIDHVQGDPFASPSSVHLELDGRTTGIPSEYYANRWRRTALEDHLLRRFCAEAERYSFRAHGSGKSGLIRTSSPGPEILPRSACRIDPKNGSILLRLRIGFPAHGRSIDAGALDQILFDLLPRCAEHSLLWRNLDRAAVRAAADLADDQQYIRSHLDEAGLVSFLADGSILPRKNGISSAPLADAIPLTSPASCRVTMNLPHRGQTSGMGIAKGVTLIVGGGYHGKSTLLSAIMHGVYNHVAGDGRELVITDPTAVKIRSEDGRSICGTNISMFINHLPNGADSRHFHSDNASGSTSQAANVAEAVESGARTLLIDEDTSATNFMMRDALMRAVIPDESEPITPYIERIGELRNREGISTVLVAGSFGAYFTVADTVIQMDHCRPVDITARAKAAAAAMRSFSETAFSGMTSSETASSETASQSHPAAASPVTGPTASAPAAISAPEAAGQNSDAVTVSFAQHRVPLGSRLPDRLKVRSDQTDGFSLNHEEIELRYIEQLVDSEQTEALAWCLIHLLTQEFDGVRTLPEAIDLLWEKLQKEGLSSLISGSTVPEMAMPRRQEIFETVNRYRGLKIR